MVPSSNAIGSNRSKVKFDRRSIRRSPLRRLAIARSDRACTSRARTSDDDANADATSPASVSRRRAPRRSSALDRRHLHPASPHGTMRRNASRSTLTLSAKPWIATRWWTLTPNEQIFAVGRRRALYPQAGRLAPPERRDPQRGQDLDQAVGHGAHVRHDAAVESDDRISDQLPGSVIGDVAAARRPVKGDTAALELPARRPARARPPRDRPRVITGSCSRSNSVSAPAPARTSRRSCSCSAAVGANGTRPSQAHRAGAPRGRGRRARRPAPAGLPLGELGEEVGVDEIDADHGVDHARRRAGCRSRPSPGRRRSRPAAPPASTRRSRPRPDAPPASARPRPGCAPGCRRAARRWRAAPPSCRPDATRPAHFDGRDPRPRSAST